MARHFPKQDFPQRRAGGTFALRDPSLAAQVVLPEDFEAMGLHHRSADFDIFKVEGEGWKSPAADEQWIGKVNIGFRLEESSQAGTEGFGPLLELNHQQITGAEWNTAFDHL